MSEMRQAKGGPRLEAAERGGGGGGGAAKRVGGNKVTVGPSQAAGRVHPRRPRRTGPGAMRESSKPEWPLSQNGYGLIVQHRF